MLIAGLRVGARVSAVVTGAGLTGVAVMMGVIVSIALIRSPSDRQPILIAAAVMGGAAMLVILIGIVAGALAAARRPERVDDPALATRARVASLGLGFGVLVAAFAPNLAAVAGNPVRFILILGAAFAVGAGFAAVVARGLPSRSGVRWGGIPAAAGVVLLLISRGTPPAPADAAPGAPPMLLTSARYPVAVVGIDGADWMILGSMIEAGVMPNLGRARAEGASGDLYIRFPFTPPSWATIFSGVVYEDHGIVDFSGRLDDWGELIRQRPIDDFIARISTQPFVDDMAVLAPTRWLRAVYDRFVYPVLAEPTLLNATHMRHKRLWQIADDFGLSSGTFGVDMSWPAEPVRGFLISDRYLRGETEAATYPADLSIALDARLAERSSPPAVEVIGDDAAARFFLEVAREQWIEWVTEITVAREALTRGAELDLVLLKFRQPDTLKHFLLPFLRPDDFPWLVVSPHDRTAVLDIIRDAYREMDGLLGDVLASGRVLCVASDHGFYPAAGKRTDTLKLDVDALLAELGWLERTSDGEIDRERSRAYDPGVPSSDGISLIRVTNAGAREELVRDLNAIRDATTGEPAFAQVQPVRDTDIRVRYGRVTPLEVALAPLDQRLDIGGREIPMTDAFRLSPVYGNHRQADGRSNYSPAVFLLHGVPIERGVRLDDVEDIDVTPTVAYLLGLPVSDELPGRVVTEAFGPGVLAERPPDTIAGYGGHEFPPELLVLGRMRAGGSTEKEIVDRIRALGYLN